MPAPTASPAAPLTYSSFVLLKATKRSAAAISELAETETVISTVSPRIPLALETVNKTASLVHFATTVIFSSGKVVGMPGSQPLKV